MSRLSFALLLLASFLVLTEADTNLNGSGGGFMPGPEVPIYASEVEECLPVWRLSLLKSTLEAEQSPLMRKVFAWLFPFGPAWNSILGTFYISSVPNFILAFIPAQINRNTLNTMTAFATGGLLSDVFLHLIPHSFMGEHQGQGVHVLIVEEKRNIIIGLAIFVGFATFFMMEKTLRVLGGENDAGHGHGHSHSHSNGETSAEASGASAKVSDAGLRSRKGETKAEDEVAPKSASGPTRMSAYLNLFGDFVHNITDGLAMAASFYASPLIGATTTLACFAHEIPHEIADYSILVRSGFTKAEAMKSQFLTAVGAFVSVAFPWLAHFSLLASHFPLAVSALCTFANILADAWPYRFECRSGEQEVQSSLWREALGLLIIPRTFMGIAVHTATASNSGRYSPDLAAGVRQDAKGILGTTAELSDLVIPFVAGGFLYIGAVAVLPTLLEESKSGVQALREFVAMAVGVMCMFLVAPPRGRCSPSPSPESQRHSQLVLTPIAQVTTNPYSPCRLPEHTLIPCVFYPHKMGTKGRSTPRVVCCAIPIARAAGKVLLITSRKRPDNWVLPKGGWEAADGRLEAAASREALEEAGVRGTVTRYVTTQQTQSTIYHFYELDVVSLDQVWLESNERRREWVDYAEAVRRLEWKAELAAGLRMSSLAPSR
ncbi:Zinc/iron permease [Mycena sanguinolenta]|uniref:Zinc/iron permease n=1 Tax=Mycena sanguinolenta TaxID=230812 RepID=A0A8H7DJK3_9AGAR|nr:Zinc/iron permease [Mycena sanguinolenta]